MYCMSIYLYIRYMWHIYMYWGTVRMYICVYVRICICIYICINTGIWYPTPKLLQAHCTDLNHLYNAILSDLTAKLMRTILLIIIICLFPSKRRGLSQPWLKGQCPLSWSYHELCDSQGSEKNRKAEARHQQIGVKPAKISRQIPLYNCS